MLMGLVETAINRATYEVKRARKILPILVRLSMTEASEFIDRLRQFREVCDHTIQTETRRMRQTRPVRRVRKVKRR